MSTELDASKTFLTSLINQTLHVHTNDGRMFVGQLKCTDHERNLIINMTHEYRQPSKTDVEVAAYRHQEAGGTGNFKVDMKKRFIGLVVIPGQYITKIELESYG